MTDIHNRLLAAGAVVLLLAAACSVRQERPQAVVALPAPVTAATVDIPGLRQPRPGLYTGGQPQADAWQGMAGRGVRTVINLRPDAEMGGRDEAAEVRAAGMVYHQIPVAGAADITAENAARLWTLLEDADGPVLVHCASGNRVGALLSIAAARQGGMDAETALAFGRAAGMAGAEARARAVLEAPPTP